MKKILPLFILLFLPACSVTMYEPVGLGMTSSVSQTEVINAIQNGIAKAGWTIQQQSGSGFLVGWVNQDKAARVNLKYHSRNRLVSFTYVDSKNLKYENTPARKSINYSYNLNLLNLEKQVALNLASIIARAR